MSARARTRRAVAPVQPALLARAPAAPDFQSPLASLAGVPARPAVQRKCSQCAANGRDEMPVQARLEIGPANDRYEREADTIAGQVMAMRGGDVTPAVPALQRISADNGAEAISASHGELASGGAPLPAATRGFFEERMGRDLSGVRVHEGDAADALNGSIGARAFTYRDHVWLGGRERAGPTFTMAHELAHVMQQTAPGPVGVDAAPATPAAASAAPGRAQRAGPPPPAAPAGSKCALELCFAPITWGYLDQAGSVHAKLNITSANGATEHSEVDPGQHQGSGDPGSFSPGAASLGWHSHVVTSAGAGPGTTCMPIAATCAQVTAVRAAAQKYEALDVVYESPMGPNSNSFAEWALNDAGLPTSGIVAPAGAWGWDYYLGNPGERARPTQVVRTAKETKCPTPGTEAADFRALVDLVRDAEAQLIACGVTDVGERVGILRGIYYGTPWSRDYGTSESSHLRNYMFNLYSWADQPRYPLECMDCTTFQSLGMSGDVAGLDVGHMFIGMDARQSFVASNAPQPIGQVTGLEAVTWAGDLGGGAARLAVERTANPTAKVLKYFAGDSYGGSGNLEGDVAGYAAGAATTAPGSVPPLTIPPGTGVADALEAYLLGTPATAGQGGAAAAAPGRDSRCTLFLTAMGGTFAAGALTNKATVQGYLAGQIESFGCWYLVNYMRQHGGINLASAMEATHHIAGVSSEMAELFMTALEQCAATPGAKLEVTSAIKPQPTPTPRSATGSCLLALTGAGLMVPDQALEQAGEYLGPILEDLEKQAEEKRRELEQQLEQKRRELEKWWNP